MHLNIEPKPVLSLCLNPAWQKTLQFKDLSSGDVHRAVSKHEDGGGKGINVIRALYKLNVPAYVATFYAGAAGQKLLNNLNDLKCGQIIIQAGHETRCCYTIIDQTKRSTTELIEPSDVISEQESSHLLEKIKNQIHSFSAISFCGSYAAGIQKDFYPKIAKYAQIYDIPVIMDSCESVQEVLNIGITFLKINARELRTITQKEELKEGAQQLCQQYPDTFFGITNGAGIAWLFNKKNSWQYKIPVLDKIVSPIGAGDCTTAILLRRIAENQDPEKIFAYYKEALSCASASCLTSSPSDFDPIEAAKIIEKIEVTKCSD